MRAFGRASDTYLRAFGSLRAFSSVLDFAAEIVKSSAVPRTKAQAKEDCTNGGAVYYPAVFDLIPLFPFVSHKPYDCIHLCLSFILIDKSREEGY